jgi:hypothetical protein
MTYPPSAEEVVAAVRKHALENYNSGGWDFVEESFSDEIILEFSCSLDTGDSPMTIAEAIKNVGYVCKLHDDRRRDIQAEIF